MRQERRPGSLLDEPEDLGQGGVPPPLVFVQVEQVGNRATALVSSRRWSCVPFEVLDDGQGQMRVREGRARPHQFHRLGPSTKLSEPRGQIGAAALSPRRQVLGS